MHRGHATGAMKMNMADRRTIFAQSKRMANEPASEAAFTPMRIEASRHNIEVVIDYAFRTGTIPERLTVDELFNEVNRHARMTNGRAGTTAAGLRGRAPRWSSLRT